MKRGTQDWICTASGRQYFPAAPRAEDINVWDIAHHLSRICRYTGAVRVEHYSVAEHSVHVSRTGDQRLAYVKLMHDWPEFALQDVNSPLKNSLPDYKRIEALNWRVGAPVLGLPLMMPEDVHLAGQRVYRAELEQIMPHRPYDDGYSHITPAGVKILALSPERAKELFLARFFELWPDAYETADKRLLPRLPEGHLALEPA